MEVLSIGNSFSCDAQRYLHQIAKAGGENINSFNLFIGGCPLSLHHKNMQSGENAYELEMNGESTGFKVSLQTALSNRKWDVITLQQVSQQSPDYTTFQPYLNELADYVRLCVPEAKIALHQTWAYEQNSHRLNEELGYKEWEDMLADVKKAYGQAAQDIKADFVIPSGELFGELIKSGIPKVHRDTFHASMGLGRYALGLLWYSALTGRNVQDNTFADLDEETSAEEIEIAKKCVNKLLEK